MLIGFKGMPYGLTPTQVRTLRALLSARLHRAPRWNPNKFRGSIQIGTRSALDRPPTERAIGNKQPRHH
jgi:hypothetical protein